VIRRGSIPSSTCPRTPPLDPCPIPNKGEETHPPYSTINPNEQKETQQSTRTNKKKIQLRFFLLKAACSDQLQPEIREKELELCEMGRREKYSWEYVTEELWDIFGMSFSDISKNKIRGNCGLSSTWPSHVPVKLLGFFKLKRDKVRGNICAPMTCRRISCLLSSRASPNVSARQTQVLKVTSRLVCLKQPSAGPQLSQRHV
jgi:hypothetical protein